ncbi:MAG TPA: hypothetical protein VGX23_34295 [Actinocrinis sp.]|nr:hypothetical protein [Actinocrinis sp.]
MTKDHRVTAGRYGRKGGQLTRDDFASIVFTLLPVDEEPPPGSAAARTSSPSANAFIPADVIAAADGQCAALAEAWPDEPIATLAESVTALLGRLAELPPDVGANVLYAAALLCSEEAERSGGPRDTVAELKKAAANTATAAGVGASAEAAFDD